MFERSELIEALAEKKESEGASEVGVERSVTSRSKPERIKIKMGEAQAGGGEAKKCTVRGQEGVNRENTRAKLKVYSCLSRARGLTLYIFFFIINRV
jgi:hypothetical protein